MRTFLASICLIGAVTKAAPPAQIRDIPTVIVVQKTTPQNGPPVYVLNRRSSDGALRPVFSAARYPILRRGVFGIRVSPNERFVAFQAGQALPVLSAKARLTENADAIHAFTVYVADLTTGEVTAVTNGEAAEEYYWQPGGNLLGVQCATGKGGTRFIFFNPATHTRYGWQTAERPAAWRWRPGPTPGIFTFSRKEKAVLTFSPTGVRQNQILPLPDADADVIALRPSPDGRYFLLVTAQSAFLSQIAPSAPGASLRWREIFSQEGGVSPSSLDCSPDGRWITYTRTVYPQSDPPSAALVEAESSFVIIPRGASSPPRTLFAYRGEALEGKKEALAWTHDGKGLYVSEADAPDSYQIVSYTLQGQRKALFRLALPGVKEIAFGSP